MYLCREQNLKKYKLEKTPVGVKKRDLLEIQCIPIIKIRLSRLYEV